MNSMTTVSTQTKRMVGLMAVVATMFTFGGTLALADHYAKSSIDGQDILVQQHQSTPVLNSQAQNARVVVAAKKIG